MGCMSAVQQVEELLAGMTRAEKAQILQRVVEDLGEAFPGVESRPEVAGGEACIVRTRVPVWVLWELRRQGVSEAEILRSYPLLRAEDLANAWRYATSHRDEVSRQAKENEEA